ncbi:hypothetical protein ScPMuIL_001084 [Solemya velum]
MSAVDSKKSKRRKYKKGSNNKPSQSPLSVQNSCQDDSLTPSVDSETWKKIEKLMDSKEESEIPHMPLHRGPNPFIDKERCLLCGCPRPDPPEADRIRAESGEKNSETGSISQLPLWGVCSVS